MNSRGFAIRTMLAVFVVLSLAFLAGKVNSMSDESLPNNLPHPNPGGKAATFSTQGNVNLTGYSRQ